MENNDFVINLLLEDLKRRMEGAIAILKNSLGGLRTGRASSALLEPIKVEAYGSSVPVSQVGTISTPEARLIIVQVWDKALLKSVEKAIASSGLGLNPISEGQMIRVPLPDLNEERRKELGKKANEYCESVKVSVRNIRRDGMDELKRREKNKHISEDALKAYSDEIQKNTDIFVKKSESILVDKVKEIMTV